MPVVSVVIPAYQAARTLAATVESVQAQTMSDIEIVVVDDGSIDDTSLVAAKLGVHCISQPNQGVSVARNRGVAAARGEFIAFLDADDSWREDKLERQLKLFDRHPEIGACFTSAELVNAHGAHLGFRIAQDRADYTAALLLHSNIVQNSSSSLLLPAELARLVPHDPRFSQCADWDLVLRLSLRTRFAPVREPLTRYRISSTSMSSSIELLERDTFAVLERFFALPESGPWRHLRRHAHSNQWMIISGSYLAAGAPLQACRAAARGIALRPAAARRVLGLPRRRLTRAIASAAPSERPERA